MLDVFEVSELTHLEKYREDWDKLTETVSNSGLFQTYEWLTSWLEAFWVDKPIAFQLVSRDGQLVGIAPLLPDTQGGVLCKGSLVSPVDSHTRRADITCAGSARDVLTALFSHLQKTRCPLRLSLENVDTASPVSDVFEGAARSAGLRLSVQEMPASPLIRIESDWQGYLTSRSRHVRRELLRKRNKLDGVGQVEVRAVTEPSEIDKALQDVLQIERRSWKERFGTSLASESNVAWFYSDLARKCAQRGWLRIYLLCVDRQPIAHIFGVSYKNEYYALNTSYDESYKHLSPGAVLFSYALEDAFSQSCSSFDFLGVEYRWKNELANAARRYVRICAFSPNAYRCRWCQTYNRKLKPLARTNLPTALALKRKLWAVSRSTHR